MQTNILGPKDATYVNTLTDLDELTKKETAILFACVQEYYEETIHRLALALSEPHGEDELAFLACILTQFYHKAGIDIPEILLNVANMGIAIDDQTTDLIVLFLLQVDKGFRGIVVDGISSTVQEAVAKRVMEFSNKSDLHPQDLDHIKLSILADELYNEASYVLALRMYDLAEKANSKQQLIDLSRRQNAQIFAEAYQVGTLIRDVNKDLSENERDLINQLFKVQQVDHSIIKAKLSFQKAERQKEAEEKI